MKILIADDHKLILTAIEQQVNALNRSCEIEKVSDGISALKIISTKNIDILITDINMPELNGLELIIKTKEISPETKIIVITYFDQNKYFTQVKKQNIDALVLKTDSIDVINLAFVEVLENRKYFSPEVQKLYSQTTLNQQISDIPILTSRELEVLKLVAKGLTTKEVADKLFLSPNTVETYRKNLRAKFEANAMQEAVAKAFKFGIL